MADETIQQLMQRVSELEERLQAMEALLARFVRFDEESSSVVLAPTELRTPLVTVLEALAEDDDDDEAVRLQLSVDEEDGSAWMRAWDEEDNLGVEISVSASASRADFLHAGVARASIVADSGSAAVEVLAEDGESPAVRMSRSNDSDASRLDVFRTSGALAAAVSADGDAPFVGLFDVEGEFATVRMINGGENSNLATIDGWRSQGERAFVLGETDDGEGGELRLFGASDRTVWRNYAGADQAGFTITNARSETMIAAAANDRSRAILVFDFLQRSGAGAGCDVGGGIGLVGETCRQGLNIHL